MTGLAGMPGLHAMLADAEQGRRWADLIAGVITGLVLVPQAVAFAQLAGLPAQYGLAASVLPMLAYALLGSSRTLSVGPVSVAALMVGAVVLRFPDNTGVVVGLVAAQAALFLLLLVMLRLEVAARVFSHPVLNGFTVAAALLIVWSQVKPLLGAAPVLRELPQLMAAPTLAAGLAAAALLYAYNHILAPWLQRQMEVHVGATAALLSSRIGPLLLLAVSAVLYRAYLDGMAAQWPVVGAVPSVAVALDLAWLGGVTPELFMAVLPSAAMIALVSYVESLAVAQSLAQKRRESIDARAELVALSAANGVAAICGAMPVAGGFSRSMVNYAAGARTQLASVVAALFALVTLLLAAGVFAYVPKFALAAIIIVAVLPLISFSQMLALWRTDRREAAVWLATFVGVLFWGLEQGLLLGAALGLLMYLAHTVRPHIAVLGRVSGTEHYRNVLRHEVEVFPHLLLLRFDESLTFLNASDLQEAVQQRLQALPDATQVVLSLAAVNYIDSSGTQVMSEIARDLKEAGIGLHLAEIKGPVRDHLQAMGFLNEFTGQIYLSVEAAVRDLSTVAGS